MRRALLALLGFSACGGAPEVSAPKAKASPVPRVEPPNTTYRVWTTGSLAKVRAEDDKPGQRDGVAESRDARISAARNETESFQIHVRALGAPFEALDVRVRSAASHGTPSFDTKNVRVFREAYLRIAKPSAPWGLTGSVPDALIPARDELTDEARNAFPIDVPRNETRSAWLDVFVPEGTVPGEYTFSVEVLSHEKVIQTVPVRLRVRTFSLPSTSSLTNAFFMSPLGMCTQAYGSYERCGAWPGAAANPDRGVEKSLVSTARFLLNRRVTLANVFYAGSEREGWDHFDATYGAVIHGGDGTRLRGAKLTSLQFVGVADVTLMRKWFQHAKARDYASRLFAYRCDEPPRGCTFADAQREGTMVHRAAEDMRWLLTGPAEKIAGEPFQRDVNILSANMTLLPLPNARPARDLYDAFAQRKNGALWWYQDCSLHDCQSGRATEKRVPSYLVDASGVQNRVGQWLSYLYEVSGELYHGVDHCFTHDCAGNRMLDPWQTLLANGGHGDGTLLYPGLPSRIGGSSPTLVSSMRLEHIRDGLEDYEYLRLLAARDRRAADHIVRKFARAVTDFEVNSEALEGARAELADAIEASK